MNESNLDLVHYPFCSPDLLDRLKNSRIMELAPDFWLLEGFGGKNFLLEPPSCNIFVVRDGDMVLVHDTGLHPYYRERLLKILQKYVDEGAKELIVTISHGHWDHGKNNDIMDEVKFEKVRFLLPEIEVKTLNISEHMISGMDKMRDFFDPYADAGEGLKGYVEWAKTCKGFDDPQYQSTWAAIEALPEKYDQEKVREAQYLLFSKVLSPDLTGYCTDRAELLLLKDRETCTFGDVQMQGWPIGRFFMIHDATQSPGHVSLYDPKYKVGGCHT